MLVVKKFGGTSVGNKDRIMNVAKRCIEDDACGISWNFTDLDICQLCKTVDTYAPVNKDRYSAYAGIF